VRPAIRCVILSPVQTTRGLPFTAITMKPTFVQRFDNLTREELLELIVQASESDKAIRRAFVTLTATPQEKAAELKKAIARLQKVIAGIPPRGYNAGAALNDIIRGIRELASIDLVRALSVLCTLIDAHGAFFIRVYQFERQTWQLYLEHCTQTLAMLLQMNINRRHLTKHLLALTEQDPHRVIATVLRNVGEYLADDVVSALHASLAEHPPMTFSPDSILRDEYVEMRKALHVARGELAAYIALAMETGGMRSHDHALVAEMYIEYEEHELAQQHISQIQPEAIAKSAEIEAIIQRAILRTNDDEIRQQHLLAHITSNHSVIHVREFVRHYGYDALRSRLANMMNDAGAGAKNGDTNFEDLYILAISGFDREVADVIDKATFVPDIDPKSCFDVICELEDTYHLRSASLLCRLLLESFLSGDETIRVPSTAYQSLLKLESMAPAIADWGPHMTHDQWRQTVYLKLLCSAPVLAGYLTRR